MKSENGITLVVLVITIVVLLLLTFVTISGINGNIIKQSEEIAEKSKIEAMRTEIKMAIIKSIIEKNRNVTLEEIINELEKQGIIKEGNSDLESGQVKTEPNGYVYEIREDENFEVIYIGKGELGEIGLELSAKPDKINVTDKVIITITAYAESGVEKYTKPDGTSHKYANAPKQINETYEITKNGVYIFTVTNKNGVTKSVTVEVKNIIEEQIQILPDEINPTAKDVIVTVIWPTGSEKAIREISVDGGETYKTYTESISKITINENTTIKARVRGESEEIKSTSLIITNIDKKPPKVTATVGTEDIKIGDNNDISKYFTIEKNGIAEISTIQYIDISNSDKEVGNTKDLTIGTHVIKCIATKKNKLSASATKVIVVNPAKQVYGGIYKISTEEYHLVFSSSEKIADGYNQNQLEYMSNDIVNGGNTSTWGNYKNLITKVNIVEKIEPTSTAFYFYNLSKVKEIENLDNIDTSNCNNFESMFSGCSLLTSLDLSKFNTNKVTNMEEMFSNCTKLTTIYVQDLWTTSEVTSSSSMFYNCSKLKGTISYNRNKTNVNYANYVIGYLKYKNPLPTTEKVLWTGIATESPITIPAGISVIKIYVDATADGPGCYASSEVTIKNTGTNEFASVSIEANEQPREENVIYVKVTPGMKYDVKWNWNYVGNERDYNCSISYSTNINSETPHYDLTN